MRNKMLSEKQKNEGKDNNENEIKEGNDEIKPDYSTKVGNDKIKPNEKLYTDI